MHESDRAAKFGRDMESQRRLAGARGAGKMHRVADFQIGKRSLGKSLDLRRGHKLIAGLSLNGVPTRLDPHDRVPSLFAAHIYHWTAHDWNALSFVYRLNCGQD